MYTDEEFYNELNRLIDLQLNEIKISYESGADVLTLVGCMNLIEFIGGVYTGKIGEKGFAEKRFKQGIALLGERYADKTLVSLKSNNIISGDRSTDSRWETPRLSEVVSRKVPESPDSCAAPLEKRARICKEGIKEEGDIWAI